ncbi:hypothetical protein [Candidatus Nitrospira neomarina]|uniref:Uncharacterized protein n=1 Tax=Candidatus Nitrospira neomarina TaxID=3020899 RepID=A0AA96GMX0_9BACT|nr:hypothetical protein [Candidatus Nitrospira neomarina]WNM63385.1 hypothetical protein PQG83_06430 [Candidatus Nitrospira neomarina]
MTWCRMAGSIAIEEWKIFNMRDDHGEPTQKSRTHRLLQGRRDEWPTAIESHSALQVTVDRDTDIGDRNEIGMAE